MGWTFAHLISRGIISISTPVDMVVEYPGCSLVKEPKEQARTGLTRDNGISFAVCNNNVSPQQTTESRTPVLIGRQQHLIMLLTRPPFGEHRLNAISRPCLIRIGHHERVLRSQSGN